MIPMSKVIRSRLCWSAAQRHGSLSLNSDGSFTYTPAANYNGSDSFVYKVNDGTADSNLATVSLTITAVNDAPVATAESYTTAEDTALVVNAASGLLKDATDIDGDSLSGQLGQWTSAWLAKPE